MYGAMVGGFGELKDATEEIQKMCDEMKCRVEGQTNEKYVEFKAVKYSSQTVAGTNYLIKVHTGGEKYIHLRLFKALHCNGGGVDLHGVLQNKTGDDPLESFTAPVVLLAQIAD